MILQMCLNWECSALNLQHTPKIPNLVQTFSIHSQSPNRRDNLSINAQRVEHLRIEISVVICGHCRKCSTPTAIDFIVLSGAEYSCHNLEILRSPQIGNALP
ncbi:hypothetical protein [Pseudanabaena yagii]|uniref:Uncharacterized protein n=1 Tax=Pseudanabaena yagii GIHE-NHR1 TaxID=2722753 RepID=A0ABX1LYH7_9CYAN|nr:hypothetical protein [Pseudanabaena yagii]NMF59819.1 hypothetical protein [Pseudanabaena yagii GIHE-NHR1]